MSHLFMNRNTTKSLHVIVVEIESEVYNLEKPQNVNIRDWQ